LATISVPSLTVRRAETTIEMGSGQSFMQASIAVQNEPYDIE